MLLAAGQVGDTTKGVLIPITGQDMSHCFNIEEVHLSLSNLSSRAQALVKSLVSLSYVVLRKVQA